MIPINELRIGSWVYDEGGQMKQVSLQDNDFWHTGNFNPIPLTSEILESCGFVERAQHDNDGNERGYYYVNKKGFVLSSDDFGASFYLKGEFKKIKVEYLHTFQNLYFALESEELTINVTADALSS